MSDTANVNRRDVIGEARSRYNEAAAKIRQSYDDNMNAARDNYFQALQDARMAYEGAIELAYTTHREAVQNVRQMLDRSDGSGVIEDLEAPPER